MSHPNTVTVRILDKDYQVACPQEQQSELLVSARYLDKQMRAIRDTGKVIGVERIAVMAALNISYELLKASEQGEPGTSLADADPNEVSQLNRKIDDALYHLRQLEIG
ncbi:cell division protein ZapA [Parahaliea mediterranea]|uniref:cell division protein ZapA n=1 Tax=Parahaliea mediterranea TaxID=651086 RepID=UPI000E2FE3A4|nr:cell division protein ZapA [Parahaliea mediterranea]